METLLNTKEEKAIDSCKIHESQMQFPKTKTFSRGYMLYNSVYICIPRRQTMMTKSRSGGAGAKGMGSYDIKTTRDILVSMKLFCILVVVIRAARIYEN